MFCDIFDNAIVSCGEEYPSNYKYTMLHDVARQMIPSGILCSNEKQ